MKITRDTLLGGAVAIAQPASGFRAGIDSLLLAASLPETGSALELGCGAGGALLPAMWRMSETQFTGLEIDAGMAGLARDNLAANGFQARGEIVEGDVAAMPAGWENKFDLVFSNPPFFAPGSITDPAPGKADAYLASVGLKDWISAALFALKPKGTFVMIHRAADLVAITSLLERRAGEIAILPVRSFPGADAKRVIVRARKGLRPGPARLLAGIALHEARGGGPTEVSRAVTGSGAALDWG